VLFDIRWVIDLELVELPCVVDFETVVVELRIVVVTDIMAVAVPDIAALVLPTPPAVVLCALVVLCAALIVVRTTV